MLLFHILNQILHAIEVICLQNDIYLELSIQSKLKPSRVMFEFQVACTQLSNS